MQIFACIFNSYVNIYVLMYTPCTVYNTWSVILRIRCEVRAKAEKYFRIACVLCQVWYEAEETVEHRIYNTHPDGSSPVNICSKYKEINQKRGCGVAREYCVLDVRYVSSYTIQYVAQPSRQNATCSCRAWHSHTWLHVVTATNHTSILENDCRNKYNFKYFREKKNA
jgi:hypothetical protein